MISATHLEAPSRTDLKKSPAKHYARSQNRVLAVAAGHVGEISMHSEHEYSHCIFANRKKFVEGNSTHIDKEAFCKFEKNG